MISELIAINAPRRRGRVYFAAALAALPVAAGLFLVVQKMAAPPMPPAALSVPQPVTLFRAPARAQPVRTAATATLPTEMTPMRPAPVRPAPPLEIGQWQPPLDGRAPQTLGLRPTLGQPDLKVASPLIATADLPPLPPMTLGAAKRNRVSGSGRHVRIELSVDLDARGRVRKVNVIATSGDLEDAPLRSRLVAHTVDCVQRWALGPAALEADPPLRRLAVTVERRVGALPQVVAAAGL